MVTHTPQTLTLYENVTDSSGAVVAVHLRSFGHGDAMRRLTDIDREAGVVTDLYCSGDIKITTSPFVHACQSVFFTPRLPWSSGKLIVRPDLRFDVIRPKRLRRKIRKGHVEAWVAAARAVCCVPSGSARYLIKRYPKEVAMVLKRLYPHALDAFEFREE